MRARGGDARTLDKLVDGLNDTVDDRHMWLSPLNPYGPPVTLWAYFDEAVTLSMVKVISPPCGGSPLCVPALTDAASQPGCVANALKDRMLSEDPRCEPKRSSVRMNGCALSTDLRAFAERKKRHL